MAEREGFEPSIEVTPYTRFPGVLLKPLGHLSIRPQKAFQSLTGLRGRVNEMSGKGLNYALALLLGVLEK